MHRQIFCFGSRIETNEVLLTLNLSTVYGLLFLTLLRFRRYIRIFCHQTSHRTSIMTSWRRRLQSQSLSTLVLILLGSVDYVAAFLARPFWKLCTTIPARARCRQHLLPTLPASRSDDDINAEDVTTTDAAVLRSMTFANLPKDHDPDVLCDFLLEIGACSASLIDADRGTDREEPLFAEPGNDPWTDSLHWAAPVWNRCNVTAHFPASVDLQGVLDMVQETFPDQFSMPLSSSSSLPLVETVPNRDWVVHVQQSWSPIVVADKFVLRFPWHDEEHVQEALQQLSPSRQATAVQLQLQGGIAFGTGEHPTTQLCMEWIDQAVHEVLQQQDAEFKVNVLDYGAGSGVLGMAACALDRERVSAIGVDIDIDACCIANQNADMNNVTMRNILPPLVVEPDNGADRDNESRSLLLKAHAHAKKQLQERGDPNTVAALEQVLYPDDAILQQEYDIVVANILAGPLVTLASTLLRMARPGAGLGLSGILAPQGEAVVQAYEAVGWEQVQVAKELGGWVLVTARKPIME